MLSAVLAKKMRGTGLGIAHQSLDDAEGAEDVLTASVFERLSYLPDESFCAVMLTMLGEPFGPLRDIEYWPSWYLDDGTRVEPDILLRDGRRSLVVEAKRYDNVHQQNPRQLANELLSGWREGLLNDDCLLLALGGLKDLRAATCTGLHTAVVDAMPVSSRRPFTLICSSWQQLYRALETHIPPNAPVGHRRLLDDLARCYAWHGLRTHPMRWLDGLAPVEVRDSSGAFDAWSMK